ncbi:MAG: hypothetical protein E5Y16_22305 [Mesorhizobium sp.]|nr:MAG: hypothetical protein E5Y16_22305 [Mesorhizobium sp.]
MGGPSVKRRLAAILAADVVGYSRLMGHDEMGTLTTLRALRAELVDPKIAEHMGRIFKATGDGVLAEFPSVVNAVACAVDIQRRLEARNADMPEDRAIRLRIGVNLGDVIVEGEDIFGDGVNIAARLESVAPAGGIAVSGTVRDHLGNRLGLQFEDMGEQALKNIEQLVRVCRVRLADTSALVRRALSLPDKSWIAVLPFVNMSGDPEQEYFSDGITEDIITELSRFRSLSVIARNSSFTYKGRSMKIPDVARDLGVTYVLEGSVRRAGNRLRITAQLIDAETGSHVWAERYDREIADMFAVQDEITQRIVGMLAVGLEDDSLERAKRKQPENLIAYDNWLRGKRLLWTVGQNNLEARQHFEKAAATDPSFSRAYSGLAVTYQMEALDLLIAAEGRGAYDMAFDCAKRALALDEADYQAHIALAWPCLYRGDYERMKKHVNRAIMLNPNDADSLANASYLLAMYGEAEKAVACGEAAMRLNPRYPDWYIAFQATALFTARRYPEALAARIRVPDYFIDSTFFRAAILAKLDRLAEAKLWAEKAVARLKARPGGVEQAAKGCIQLLLDNNPFRRQEDRDHFAEAMRMAGVPG